MATIETIKAGTRICHEIEIKKSRFIATIARTDSVQDARALIDEVKASHPQARHNCSTYLIHADGLNPQQHSSDDGEPSGTAGTPMLEALRLAGVWNVTGVVTRYFGGILLGGGGLIRAYSSAVSEALALCPRAHLADLHILETQLNPGDAGRIEAELRATGAHVLGTDWASKVALRIGVYEGELGSFDNLLAELTSGVAKFQHVGTEQIEVDGPSNQE
ncbi:IMPACT family protein [Schaalia vaccimaxillae]|uniref:IMPACT family protein n=1 Tax=Schaalia vaccimaxillae TaxID=183916 RepID=UPI0003B5FA08|nr:YigZ family protein [Schaalia vaccimaxillae]